MIPPAKNTPGAPPLNALPPGGFCSACGAALSNGARFCHRCGTPVGLGVPPFVPSSAKTGPSPVATALPWALAFVALLALVSNFVGKNFGRAKGSAVDGSSNAISNPSIDGGGAPFAGGTPPASGAPDINNMSASERANRLYVRIMTYAENNKLDSVGFFAPMAIAAHGLIEKPSNDERYHFGRIGEITGDAGIARAQADTILQTEPNSLLGLLLEVRVARMNKDKASEARFNTQLLQHLSAELGRNVPEYIAHRSEIDRAAAEARANK